MCKISNKNGNLYDFCEEDYYLGLEDFKCTKIDGCLASENVNKCIKCDEYYCLDINIGKCVFNDFGPETENKKIIISIFKSFNSGFISFSIFLFLFRLF